MKQKMDLYFLNDILKLFITKDYAKKSVTEDDFSSISDKGKLDKYLKYLKHVRVISKNKEFYILSNKGDDLCRLMYFLEEIGGLDGCIPSVQEYFLIKFLKLDENDDFYLDN